MAISPEVGYSARESADSAVAEALTVLRGNLDALKFPFALPSADEAEALRADGVNQLDDYILPRYASLDAPLLAVIGGSTGAGKSTLLNSVLGENITRASAIRPTTRRPVLAHHPDDASWFENDRILPNLARAKSGVEGESAIAGAPITELRLAVSGRLPQGLAVLDSPDIDSVVKENRELANQLLSAADLWVFVTTAARYADAIPWAMLDEAAARNIVVAVVLNRVPAGVGAEVRADLARRLESRGLSRSPLFVISEKTLDDAERLPEGDIAPIRTWLTEIARDASARASVARQTLAGAVAQLAQQRDIIVGAAQDQSGASERLREAMTSEFGDARAQVLELSGDGSLLRGEVLQRWQDVVGTGAWTRKLETGVSRIRDRITAFFGAKKVDTREVEVALEQSILDMLVNAGELAGSTVIAQWRRMGASAALIDAAMSGARERAARETVARALVHDWQAEVLAMIREQGESKKFTARVVSFGVNAVGVALMVFVFANTGGLVGGEIAVAGGTAVVAQKLLEAVFGEDAVRRMAQKARRSLQTRIEDYFSDEEAPYADALVDIGLPDASVQELAKAYDELDEALRVEKVMYSS
ncbi:MAG: dynamin family protein [Actinomycetaceae bacterium]|nr:dynamin family protein [Arcanobacterium sp.]MDD7504450.1 dynamin family protein [Actinomycetaceae bacterium]